MVPMWLLWFLFNIHIPCLIVILTILEKKIEISRDNYQNVYVNEFSLLDAIFRSKQFPTNDRLMDVYASGQLELQ